MLDPVQPLEYETDLLHALYALHALQLHALYALHALQLHVMHALHALQ